MAELTQRTLGLVRDALFEMEPDDVVTVFEKKDFWKQKLFDAGVPTAFIDVAKSYDFRWTDIIPALYTAKFGEQNVHFSTLVPPTLCEQFLKKLIVLAVNASLDTPLGERLRESLSDDGIDANASLQTKTPAELTKLPDKSSLLRDLTTQIQGGKLVSLVFVDLDNFKQVNDQHGHSEGDECLVEVIANVSGATLGKGKIYRVGGDEFCVVLPNFSCSEAAATAERVRLGVDGLDPFGGTTKVTTSIGVAASDTKGVTSPESLVEAADEAMYVSKWTTKNRVTIWPASDADRQLARDNRERAKSFQRLSVLEEQVQSLQAQQDQLATQETRNEQERQRKQEVRNKLAAFLTEAQGIKNSLEYNNSASVYQKTDWERRVEQYLTENLEQSYAVRFRSSKHQVTAYPTGINSPTRMPWAEINARMAMLDDFISELRD